MMKKLFILFLTLVTCHLSAQTFTNYTANDGLINNAVNCLTIDSNDNLWFGTQEGISFFDGENWTNYDVNSHPDLVSNTITAIAVDSDNHLWIGTDFGLNKFDGTTWTTYTDENGLADDRVRYINQDADGNIWVANNDGISIFDGTDWLSYTMADGLPFGGTNFVTFDSEGNTWLGTPLAGILVFTNNTFLNIDEDDGLLSDNIRSIAIDANNQKWIGTADGITVLDENNNFVTHHEYIFELPPPDELNPVEDVQIDSEGRIWVGVYVDYLVTEGGVSLFNSTEVWQDYDVDDGLVGPVVRRLDIDSQDNVWVATSTGVSKIGDIPSKTLDMVIDGGIKISPNPTAATLMVQVPAPLIGTTYQIFNAFGLEVANGELWNELVVMDLGNLMNGVYFLMLDGDYVRRVVVSR